MSEDTTRWDSTRTHSPGIAGTEAISTAGGVAAPRVSADDIHDAIESEVYLNLGDAVCRCGQPDTAPMHLMTLCIITLKNGWCQIGYSAPASPENYDETKGRIHAKENAMRELWPKMGFALRDRLHKAAAAD